MFVVWSAGSLYVPAAGKAVFELHPVEGVNHSAPAALDEQMLLRVRHAVEVDVLSPDVAEWLGESQIGVGKFGREEGVVADWAQFR